MMVWHGGLSGSAPLKVAEANHFLSDRIGIIPVNETIFSSMNLTLFALFLLLIPITFFVLSKVKENRCTANTDLPKAVSIPQTKSKRQYLGFALGVVLACMAAYQFYLDGLPALNINLINLMLLALGLLLYTNLEQFMKAVNSAIASSSLARA